MTIKLDEIQSVQEDQYIFPYHYLPISTDKKNTKNQHWSWGYHYIAGINKIITLLPDDRDDVSILDVGCGDGRFLYELHKIKPNFKKTGIDYSERAIRFAEAINGDDITFIAANLSMLKNEKLYDIITLIEVLEHIKPDEVNRFLVSIRDKLKTNGKFIITVPHTNTKLHSKHYQHYNSNSLMEVVANAGFKVEDVIPFDKKSLLNKILLRVIGGGGKNFLITNNIINNYISKLIKKSCSIKTSEKYCQRLILIARVAS